MPLLLVTRDSRRTGTEKERERGSIASLREVSVQNAVGVVCVYRDVIIFIHDV